jgi:hypothetical protein
MTVSAAIVAFMNPLLTRFRIDGGGCQRRAPFREIFVDAVFLSFATHSPRNRTFIMSAYRLPSSPQPSPPRQDRPNHHADKRPAKERTNARGLQLRP